MGSQKKKRQPKKHRVGKAVLVGLGLSLVLGGPWALGYYQGHNDGFVDGEKALKARFIYLVGDLVRKNCNIYCKVLKCHGEKCTK